MRFIQLASFSWFLVMTISLTYGIALGTFWDEGGVITDLTWGVLTLVDFYVGAFYIMAWIAFREKDWWKTIVWIIFVICLGNWTVSLYVFLASRSCKGDWKTFFMGHRANIIR